MRLPVILIAVGIVAGGAAAAAVAVSIAAAKKKKKKKNIWSTRLVRQKILKKMSCIGVQHESVED